MTFAIPMVRREQKNHYDDCFSCLIDITGFSIKNRHIIAYPDLESAPRPGQIPKPQQINFESEMVEDLEFAAEVHKYCTGPNYVPKINY